MTDALPIDIAGIELWLLADRALYWPARKALLIADIHLGKAAAYRRLGQPVPQGTTATNLDRLDRLLERYAVTHLIVLGDFLHAPESHNLATLQAVETWRERHASLQITLIRGNHDRRAGDPPSALRITTVAEPLLIPPFALHHEPQPRSSSIVIAGHVHPTYRLQGRARQNLRLPCFRVSECSILMPAFGEFTGGMDQQAPRNERLFVTGAGRVWEVGRAVRGERSR